MNDPTLEELLEGWKEETITAKEAIDQLLRHLRLLLDRVRALERGLAASPPPPPATGAATGTARHEAPLGACKETSSAWLGGWRLEMRD